jgi:hypothetical protein
LYLRYGNEAQDELNEALQLAQFSSARTVGRLARILETPGVETLVSLRRRVLVVGALTTPSCSCQPNKNLRHPTNDLHFASFIQLCDLATTSPLLLPRQPNVTRVATTGGSTPPVDAQEESAPSPITEAIRVECNLYEK